MSTVDLEFRSGDVRCIICTQEHQLHTGQIRVVRHAYDREGGDERVAAFPRTCNTVFGHAVASVGDGVFRGVSHGPNQTTKRSARHSKNDMQAKIGNTLSHMLNCSVDHQFTTERLSSGSLFDHWTAVQEEEEES